MKVHVAKPCLCFWRLNLAPAVTLPPDCDDGAVHRDVPSDFERERLADSESASCEQSKENLVNRLSNIGNDDGDFVCRKRWTMLLPLVYPRKSDIGQTPIAWMCFPVFFVLCGGNYGLKDAEELHNGLVVKAPP